MLRIGLFALTGTGNSVLRALVDQGHPPRFLITRRETGPYPYYPVLPLADVAKDLGIPVHFDFSPMESIRRGGLDLILSATFHKFVGPAVREKAAHAINLHPSLLPHLKGRNPFYWTIRNGDPKAGVTAHVMEDEMDSGAAVWRQEIAVSPDEDQGALRQRLATVAAAAAGDIVHMIGERRLTTLPAFPAAESFAPNPSAQDLELSNASSREDLWRRYRAAMPYPGATFSGKKVVDIKDARDAPAAGVTALSASEYMAAFADGAVTVKVAPAPD